MYECEHWSCDANSGEKSTVCLNHSEQFARGQLDFCPGCDLLKEKEFTFCGDCDIRATPGGLLDFDDFLKREIRDPWLETEEWDFH